MKSTELMIGDWVMYNGNPVKVLQLSEGKDYKSITPIPLTPEILEKNGFSASKKFRTYHYQQSGVYISVGMWGRITISSEGNKFGNRMNIDCQYVHELQHALHNCRIEKEIVL